MKALNNIILIVVILAILSCSKENGPSSTGSDSGTGGSLARFTIVGDYLYTVDNQSLKVFNITEPTNPEFIKSKVVGFGIETIFPKGNTLFLGSQRGMYIYDISEPESPTQVSLYQHIYSCDPVIVEGNYAYVTLHSGNSWCGRMTNELHVIDISDLSNPKEIKTYPMQNPLGLGIDNNELFVCDDGLKVYDASDPLNLVLKQHFQIEAFDVIPVNGLLIVIGNDGLYQYSYSGTEVSLLSKIQVTKSLNQ